MSPWFNLGSLLLGLTAWGLGLAAWAMSLLRLGGRGRSWGEVLSLGSFSACAAALCLQFFEICRRVELHDFSALMDTSEALAKVAVVLVVITLLLNFGAAACRTGNG